ncbi:MAG TPA: hypothetical protein VFL86_11330, partial [Burkholderiaceae bacterium]|nr:hypothetical protein [Burkholderiaceae bacterium]
IVEGGVVGWRSDFNADADAKVLQGGAHVAVPGAIKLVNRPEAHGSWATSRYNLWGGRTFSAGATVSYELTPQGLQAGLHAGIDTPGGSGTADYAGLWAVLQSDGRVMAKVQSGAAVQWVDLGSYQPGVTLRVEITTSRAGAVLYVYPKGSDRASGLIHRTALPVAAAEFTPVFVTNRQATQSGETSTLLAHIDVTWGSEVTSHRYDAAGRLTDSVDAEGVLTRRSYDALGRETRRTVGAGLPEASSTAWAYDAAGRMLTETVADGTPASATTRYRHDALGRVVEQVDACGEALAVSDSAWAVAARLERGLPAQAQALSASQQESLRRAYTMCFEYDAAGRRTAVVDALGGRSTTGYDALGRPVVQVDARGFASHNVYDLLGRRVQQIDAEGGLSTATYDTFGNVVATQQYAGRVVRPEQGRVSVLAAGSVPPAQGAYLVADAALTRLTLNEFTLLNQMSRSVDAQGQAESSVFNAFGQAEASTNRVGGTARYQYDRLGRLIQETLPVQAPRADGTMLPVQIQHQYDHRGHRVQTTEAAGLPEQRITQYRFDAMGRLLQTQGMACTAVDAAGTASVVPVDQNRYDALGRIIEQVQGGNLASGSVVGGRRTLAWYDAAGRKTAELSADAVLAEWGYDPAGRMTTQTVRAARLASRPMPGGSPPSVAASADDRTLRHSHDALGRKTQTRLDGVWSWEEGQPVTLPGAQTLTLEQLRYDAAGNVIQHTDARGNASFSYYDGLNRKRLAIDTGGYATAWDYALPGSTATQETRYARRVPLAAYDGGTDPQAVRNALAALGADPNERDRVTVFRLDRLGRVAEKQVLQVDFATVDDAGATRTGTASAITAYRYDGLGHVTQLRERIGLDLWQTTEVAYDSLGREIQRLAPGFVDHQNQDVRPTTQTEYDGLGRTRRVIQRGKDTSTEADDRITRYSYGANGLLSELVDAEGGITRNSYDALGNVSRQTRVGVLRSDGSRRDIVKTWQYDAAGRVAVETDLGTGEARQTAYTAFGEISAKGLNGGWQEFAEYSTRGLVWKTNSGDGAVKIYLQDKNGNTTREIRAGLDNGTDLRGLTLAQASADDDKKFMHSVSVYDARNLRVKTTEQRIERLDNEVTLSQQFTEKWLPRPGDLNINFPQAAVGPQVGHSTVTVSEGAETKLDPNLLSVVAGGVDRGAPPVTGAALRSSSPMSFGSFVVTEGEFRSSIPTQVGTTLTLPAWPGVGTYFVKQTRPGQAAVQIADALAPGKSVKVGDGDQGTYKLEIEWQAAPPNTVRVPVAQIRFSKWIENERQVRGATFSVLETLQPGHRIVLDFNDWKGAQAQEPARFVAIVDADKPGQSFTAAPAMAPWAAGVLWPASSRLASFDLTSPLRPPLSAGDHTLTIMAFDANGSIVSGRNYKMTGGANPTLDETGAAPLLPGTEGTLWSQNIRNSSNALAGRQLSWDLGKDQGYTFRWRVAGSADRWSQRGCSGPEISDSSAPGWPGADGAYECAIVSDRDGSIRYGRYEVSGGAISVANPLLDKISLAAETLVVSGPPSLPGTQGFVRLSIGNDVFEAATDAAGRARFDLTRLRQRQGYDHWAVASINYTSEGYILHDGGLRERTHCDAGTLRLGLRFDARGASSMSVSSDRGTAAERPFYRSIGTVTLMNAKGRLTLRTMR